MVVLKCGWARANTFIRFRLIRPCGEIACHYRLALSCLLRWRNSLDSIAANMHVSSYSLFCSISLLLLIICYHAIRIYFKWICSKNEPAKRMQWQREKLQFWRRRRQGRFIWHSISSSMHFIIFILNILHTRVHTAQLAKRTVHACLWAKKQQCSRHSGLWVEQRKNENTSMRSVYMATNQIENRRMQVDAHTRRNIAKEW